jgi:hypothetical protein
VRVFGFFYDLVVATDIISKNAGSEQTVQWTELMEACLRLISHLVYKCEVNKDRFMQLQGNKQSSTRCLRSMFLFMFTIQSPIGFVIRD